MSDWQERITHETAPAIRVEHELRYRIAAPLIATSALWVDLGCGNGLTARAALGAERPDSALLLDVEPDIVAGAARELCMAQVTELAGDLTHHECLKQIARELRAADGERTVTCFEVVEHLSDFIPLIQWSSELAARGEATFVISVPNDAFWAIQNPHHRTAWGDGAFEELRRLLPDEQTLYRQVALSGSALAGWDGTEAEHKTSVAVGGPSSVATHFIAAYGPRHGGVWRGALTTQSDMLAQRRWERERESNLATMEAAAAEMREQLRANTAEFTAWRTYIHELESELGRPLSGAAADASDAGTEPSAGYGARAVPVPSDGARESDSRQS